MVSGQGYLKTWSYAAFFALQGGSCYLKLVTTTYFFRTTQFGISCPGNDTTNDIIFVGMNLRFIYEKCFQLPFKLFLLVLEESLVGRHRLHELVLVVLEVALHLGTQKDDNYTIF